MQRDQPLAGCRILVVEDDYFIAEALSDLLESAGAEVIGPLGSLDHVMAQVQQDGFEVAVLDINLRGTECYPAADELTRQGVPFVFASAYGNQQIPRRFAGVRFWTKPYNERGLVEDVQRLCKGLRPL